MALYSVDKQVSTTCISYADKGSHIIPATDLRNWLQIYWHTYATAVFSDQITGFHGPCFQATFYLTAAVYVEQCVYIQHKKYICSVIFPYQKKITYLNCSLNVSYDFTYVAFQESGIGKEDSEQMSLADRKRKEEDERAKYEVFSSAFKPELCPSSFGALRPSKMTQTTILKL